MTSDKDRSLPGNLGVSPKRGSVIVCKPVNSTGTSEYSDEAVEGCEVMAREPLLKFAVSQGGHGLHFIGPLATGRRHLCNSLDSWLIPSLCV